jgi:hypothetical protein
VQKVGIGELLDPSVDERDAEEAPEDPDGHGLRLPPLDDGGFRSPESGG